MSKNDIPFHQVIMNFVNNLEMPKEIGINGVSYSYGGSNICFDTNNSYPIISVKLSLSRKGQFTVSLSFFPSKQLSISFKLFYLKKMLSLCLNAKQFWVMQLRPFFHLYFHFDAKEF
jgi:hypothetical protein